MIPRDNRSIQRWFKQAGVTVPVDKYLMDLALWGMFHLTQNGWDGSVTIEQWYTAAALESEMIQEAIHQELLEAIK